MTDEERTAAQMLTQGPDTGLERAVALADVAEGFDPSVEFRHTILPGLFFVDPRPHLEPGEVGLPAASMASGVGGMGIHWGTSTPRPQQSERIPFLPADEMDAALDHAEELLGVEKPVGPGEGLSAALRTAIAHEFDGPGLTPVQFMASANRHDGQARRFSGTGVILGDLEAIAPGFELRARTLARRVIVEDGVAVGAELEDLQTGEVKVVRATYVVVCADGLRTPQVLFASGIRPPALGRHLNEHFQVTSFAYLNDELDPSRFVIDPARVGYVIVPFSDARPMQGGTLPLALSPYNMGLGDDPSLQRLAVVVWYGAKDIQETDAVEFSDTETDWVGMPKMRVRYSHTAKDTAVIGEMVANVKRTAAVLGTLTEEPTLAAGGSSLHYQGTVRMGPVDDGTSVCDPGLRVWGVENLYVGGNGVIPTSTATNPTLTTVALAWRAASDIATRLRAPASVGAEG
jgi:choline dehydrogenase-like flavoprotein